MDHDQTHVDVDDEQLRLPENAHHLGQTGLVIGGCGIVFALIMSLTSPNFSKRFLFAYLVGFAYILSLSLGGLFFVLIQHVTKAAWSVGVRRIAEWLAASMPVVGLLGLPIILPTLFHSQIIYPWADLPVATMEVPSRPPTSQNASVEPGMVSEKAGELEKAGDEEMSPFKKVYLDPFFWTGRMVVYFIIWSIIGNWYWRTSLRQDTTGDVRLTERMQLYSPAAMIIFALTLTLASFDLFMALDPSWSSTIFGVYFFAGCVVNVMATLILVSLALKRYGLLRHTLTIEHYHDLGKLMFAFTFFWGYIAFSQFMLQWYGNLPEETAWYRYHGATTAAGSVTGWSYVIIALLFGNLLIPFAALMSRHVKRHPKVLAVMAVWMLLFHFVDLYWIITPTMDHAYHYPFAEFGATLGLVGVLMATMVTRAREGAMRPIHDPRLEASVAFQNV